MWTRRSSATPVQFTRSGLDNCFRSQRRSRSATIHAPKSLAMIAKLQQAIFRVVALSAVGTHQETAPLGSMTIVLLGNSKAGSATARDEKHSEWFGGAR